MTTDMNDAVVGVVESKVAKRKSVTLTSGTSRLTILAQRKADDTGVTTVTTVDAKTKKTVRGMTKRFDSFDLAIEALAKLEKDAIGRGWKKTERSGGFKARPDAFSVMPAAPKVGK